jgi:hypothetical protein
MRAVILSTTRGICGATPADEDAFRKFKARILRLKSKPGQWLRIEFSTPRHGKHHRKFFALMQLIAENSEVYDTAEKALIAVKLCTGHLDLMPHPETGEIVQIPRSVSFESMGQEDFEAFYDAALKAVCAHIVPHLREADRDRILDEIAAGWL